jgi:hypothetical protein
MNGPVKLIADPAYGKQNSWDKIFSLYYDTAKSASSEANKSIIVAPDGSVFMSHKNRYEIWKFDPDGSLEKRFGSKGSKPGQFVMLPSIQCIIGSKYVLTSDVGGRLNLFDLNGDYYKTINLKYMPLGFLPLENRNVLLHGFAIWKSRSRHIVVNLNTDNGVEKIVHDYFTEFNKTLTIDNVDSLISSSKGHNDFRIPGFGQNNYTDFTFLRNGKFMKSERKTAEYSIFGPEGRELLKARMELDPVKITEADVQQNYELMKKTFSENVAGFKKMLDPNGKMRKNNPNWSPVATERYMRISQKWLDNIDVFRDIKNYYPYFPLYSNILTDDEGNVLVFEYTSVNDKVNNRFNVIAFDKNGKRLARTSFVCDDYDLTFSRGSFVFSKGYVYAIAKKKNPAGMPLRLVKFKVTN